MFHLKSYFFTVINFPAVCCSYTSYVEGTRIVNKYYIQKKIYCIITVQKILSNVANRRL